MEIWLAKISANVVVSATVAKERIMKTQNSEIDDAVHWLKAAMRQTQSNIEKQSKKIIELENQIKRLRKVNYQDLFSNK